MGSWFRKPPKDTFVGSVAPDVSNTPEQKDALLRDAASAKARVEQFLEHIAPLDANWAAGRQQKFNLDAGDLAEHGELNAVFAPAHGSKLMAAVEKIAPLRIALEGLLRSGLLDGDALANVADRPQDWQSRSRVAASVSDRLKPLAEAFTAAEDYAVQYNMVVKSVRPARLANDLHALDKRTTNDITGDCPMGLKIAMDKLLSAAQTYEMGVSGSLQTGNRSI